jgi:hypothetical protein
MICNIGCEYIVVLLPSHDEIERYALLKRDPESDLFRFQKLYNIKT